MDFTLTEEEWIIDRLGHRIKSDTRLQTELNRVKFARSTPTHEAISSLSREFLMHVREVESEARRRTRLF